MKIGKKEDKVSLADLLVSLTKEGYEIRFTPYPSFCTAGNAVDIRIYHKVGEKTYIDSRILDTNILDSTAITNKTIIVSEIRGIVENIQDAERRM